MSLNIDQIAEAFCCQRFFDTHPSIWLTKSNGTLLVGKKLIGRGAVIDPCYRSAKFLEIVSTTLQSRKINRAEIFVFVEGTVQFQDQENPSSSVTSCAVFQFSDGHLSRLHHMPLMLNKP